MDQNGREDGDCVEISKTEGQTRPIIIDDPELREEVVEYFNGLF